MEKEELMSKKVLAIGGAGYLGGLVVDKLLEDGHQVTVFDNLLYEERYLKPINFVYGSILNTDHVLSVAKDFDYVVWLAALVGDPICEIDRDLTNKVNHIAVKDFCQRLDESVKMIFFSTCSVYGLGEGILDENSPTNPLSAYASTKLAAEKYVLDRGGCVFRLGTVFGLGDTYSRLRLDLVVNVMTMKAFLDNKITVNGGEQWRPLISVDDVAEYTRRCVNNFTPGVFALNYKNVIIRDLGKEIASLIPYTTIEYNEVPFQDLRNYQVDSSKAQNTFNYVCKTSVADEVHKIYKLLSERRIRNLNDIVYHNGTYLKHNKEVAMI